MTELFHVGEVSHGSPIPESLSENLRLAASRGHVQNVKDLLVSGAGLGPDKDGRNALHHAAQEGHAEICKYLTAHGCDVNMRDVMGYTPLLRAASQGAQESVQMLLDAGCDADIQDEHGNAAIHETCWNGFSQTAELLVKYNCSVCLTNKAGFTALHLSAQNGHNECSRVLLYAGCNPDLQNNYGDTALHTAARYGHAGVTRILISARCKLNEQNKNGDTALHISAALKRRKIAKILVESAIDTELLNKQNERAVDVAQRKEHPEIILIISSYSKPRPSSFHRSKGDNVGVTFKKAVDFEDRLDVCPLDETLHKQQPKVDKQEKEKRFFFFKKKKKEKEKVLITPAASHTKTEVDHIHAGHGKTAVHGFFSQYVPRDGVQLYRDLAGNIKQGPIGYAPVCQCGPSLRRLENSITDTRESLHHRIDASHHILSQRIDHLDFQTKQQTQSTETTGQEIFNNESNACHNDISEHLQEERLKTPVMFDHTNANIKGDLEYWLNDKLASYGHCLDHHHDDSALPPRNLFFDFPTMGRLVRSRSDETLSASDYSGKFRKKDFYASRQAAMQQIRGWDIPHTESFSNQDRPRRKERNNNVIPNRVVTQAQVHSLEPDRGRHVSPSIIQTTLADTSITPMKDVTLHNAEQPVGKTGSGTIKSKSANVSWKLVAHETPQTNYVKKTIPHSRVTFSNDKPVVHFQQPHQQHFQQPHQQHFQQPHQHRVQQPHQKHFQQPHQHRVQQPHQQPLRSGVSSPPFPLCSQNNAVDQAPLVRQSLRTSARITNLSTNNNTRQQLTPSAQHTWSAHQNLIKGSPSRTEMKPSELRDSRTSSPTGQDNISHRNSRQLNVHQISSGCHNNYDNNYNHPRTLSADSLLSEETHLFYSRDTARCHSVENTLDSDSKKADMYNSGYFTDSALRPSPTRIISRNIDGNQSVKSTHSTSLTSRSTYRYRLPETSTSPDHAKPEPHAVSLFDPSLKNSNFQSKYLSKHDQIPTNMNKFVSKKLDSSRPIVVSKPDASRELNYSKPLHRSVYGLSEIVGTSGPGLGTCIKKDAAIYPEKSDSMSRSDGNLTTSKTNTVHLPSLGKECLQHESFVSANSIPSPTYAVRNKEDSTCSSNQDSGYSSRNHAGGLTRVVDTSGGTPSSSFSMERSSCNTPSNTDSPYTNHGEFSGTGSKTFLNNNSPLATVQANTHQFSSSDLLGKNAQLLPDGSEINIPLYRRSSCENSGSCVLDAFNINNNPTMPFRHVSLDNDVGGSFDYFHKNSTFNNKPAQVQPPSHLNMSNVQRRLTHRTTNGNMFVNNACYSSTSNFHPEKQLQSDKINNGESEEQTPVLHREAGRRSYLQQNYLKDDVFNERNSSQQAQSEQTYRPPLSQQAQSEQTYRHPLPNYTGTSLLQQAPPSEDSNQFVRQSTSHSVLYSQQQVQDTMSQAAVQDHIQGWYQRKLMEAAQRLRQNHNYSKQNFDQQETRIEDYPQGKSSFSRTSELSVLPYASEQPPIVSPRFSSQNKPLTANSLQYGSMYQSRHSQW